jgi:hypothetical protein
MSSAPLIDSAVIPRIAGLILVVGSCFMGGSVAQAAPEPGSAGISATPPSVLIPLVPMPSVPVPSPGPTIAVIPAPLLTPAPIVPPPPLAPDMRLGTAEVVAEIGRLRKSLAAEVPQLVPLTPDSDRRWTRLARAQLAATHTEILRPQLIVVVDRSVKVQQLALIVAQPDDPYDVIGVVHVSTGQSGRFDHYVTPTGVFRHTDAILDYRAQGTYNENHIRGLGLKGMRVWDFGWQWAHKGWSPAVGKPLEIQIRLEMHATDPAVLEQRIGRTASQGCVRIPSTMNRFLDRHGVLDAIYERAAVTDIRYRALLLRDRTESSLAGDALVVVDSSLPLGTPPDQHAIPEQGVGAKGAAIAVTGRSG